MAKGMSKGSAYERKICKQLSLWWTDGNRDDVFWRTQGSGARATTRGKSGKSTFGQYGDVQATDPIGSPFTELLTVEIKRGYSQNTFADLIERHQNPKVKKCMFQKFIGQAEKECDVAKTYAWLLICKRNARTPIVVMPSYFFYNIDEDSEPCYRTMAEVVFYNDNNEYQNIIITYISNFVNF